MILGVQTIYNIPQYRRAEPDECRAGSSRLAIFRACLNPSAAYDFYICMGDHVNKLFSERDTCQFITHAIQTTAAALDATVHQILTAQA